MIGSFLIYSLSSWLVLVAVGLALGCLGLILAPTWLPSTSPLGPLRAPWGPFGVPWGSLGGPLGVPWEICRKLDAQFRANVFICTCLRIESSFPELAYGAYGASGARGNGSRSAAQTPPGHARRGLGLREFHKLPQTIILLYYHNIILS